MGETKTPAESQQAISTPNIVEYRPSFTEFGQEFLSKAFDLVSFNWVNENTPGKYQDLDAQRRKMLEENPGLDVRNLSDGYELEAEKLNAINQKNSRGLQVIDINPALLDPLENALTLPYEFIFDGTNFIPEPNDSLTQNFRSVNIPYAGNFLKVEYIYENNSTANININSYRPFANIKYAAALKTALGEQDLTTDQRSYTFDNFARNKVFVDFGTNFGKPHIVPSSGRIFKTYFNELTIHLNIGSPKIRLTIGYNSEVHDASSSAAPINAKKSMTGAARILADSDTVLNPFCVTDQDYGPIAFDPQGYNLQMLTTPQALNFNYITNSGNNSAASFRSLGYSVLWITRIHFMQTPSDFSIKNYLTVQLYLYNNPGVGQPQEIKRVHQFKITNTNNVYTFEPEEPIRVTIPSGWSLRFGFFSQSATDVQTYVNWCIDGYSYGELNKFDFEFFYFLYTSKFITDATFLSDYNMTNCLKDF